MMPPACKDREGDGRVGGLVGSAAPGSVADECGMRPDDCLMVLSGRPLRDVLDYRSLVAATEVERLTPVRRRFRRLLGCTFPHVSDEFYTVAGLTGPPATWYDGYPPLENGVGLVRRLLNAWAHSRHHLPQALARPRRVGWICGNSAYPAVLGLAADLNLVVRLHVAVLPVVNRFFGAAVTVSGLLTGGDVMDVLRAWRTGGWILPRAMLDGEGHVALDGMTFQRLRSETPDPVPLAESAGELMKLSLFGSALCAE